MEGSRREVEVKLRFDSADAARNAIARIGAEPHGGRVFEDNVLFDRVQEPLAPKEQVLRLRRVDERAVLTYKAPVAGEHRHKVRVEYESAVAEPDAVASILAALGFTPRWRYQKFRTVFRTGGVEICLDETPLGCFVELEGAPDEIDRAAKRLGFSPSDYVLGSYRDLHVARARCEGRDSDGDLVFPAPLEDRR